MPDTDILNRRFRPEFRRERKLQQSTRSVPPPAPDAGPVVETMATHYRQVSTKAARLLQETVRLAQVRRVPVDPAATAVRAATHRQDPTSQGAFITFELYQRATHVRSERQHALPIEILDQLTGDPIADQQNLTKQIRKHSEGLDDASVLLLGNQLVTLFVLKLLQLGQDSLEGGQQSATKAPPGLEVPIIVANIALSLTAQQLYAGLNKEQAEDALAALGQTVPSSDTHREAARAFLAQSPLFQAALTERGPSDLQLIIAYVQTFLDRQTEPGWETWQLAPDLATFQTRADSAAGFLDRYAASESRRSTDAPADPLQTLQSRLHPNTMTETTVELGAPMQALYGRGLQSLNQQVDHIAQVLADQIDPSSLCCFLEFLGSLSTQTVKMLRGVLEVQQKQFQVTQPSSASLPLTLSLATHQQLLGLLQDLQHTLFRKLRAWLTKQADQWNEWFQCSGLIDELVEYVVQAMENLEQTFVSLLDRFLEYLEVGEQHLQSKLNSVGNQKRIRFQLTSITEWLDFGGIEGLCPDSVAEPAQLATVAERVLDRMGASVQLPSTGTDPFQTVQSPPFTLSTGVHMPATLGPEAGHTILTLAKQACGRRFGRSPIPFPR